jgi:predicted enzyme related to lactoylglutathione lyase
MSGEAAKTSTGDEVMSQAEQDRRIDYIEFLTTDIEDTKRFYAEVFGWEFIDYGPEYASFVDGRLGGGFALAPEVAKWSERGTTMTTASEWASAAGGPLVVLYATNLEEIEDSIREAGGRIVRDPFEFPGGRRFHFTDPGGNELAVWSDR